MPLTEPQNRPGTHLSPLDRLCSREHAAPDKAGEAWGMVWAAWRQFSSDSDRYGKIKVYIADAETGELIKGLETYAYDRQRTRDYHTVESWDELHERLWRMYWTHLYDGTHPLTGLQEHIRRQTREKARKQHHEKKMAQWQSKWRVKTDHTGRGAHHQVVPQK